MKIESLLDPNFKSGMAKLINGNIPMKALFKLEGILDAVNDELSRYENTRQNILKKRAKLKEDGTMEMNEGGNVVFKSEEDTQQFFKEYAELISLEVSIGAIRLVELGDLDRINVNLNMAEFKRLKETVLLPEPKLEEVKPQQANS